MDGIGRDDPRVQFAAERTLLAWVRTGLAMMGFGFVVARFGVFLQSLSESNASSDSVGLSQWAGIALVGLGAAVTFASAWRYFNFVSGVSRGAGQGIWARYFGIVVALVLGGIGILMVVYLARTGP